MAKQKKKETTKKAKQKIIDVDNFHLNKAVYNNKSATAILNKVSTLASAYKLNKHNKKELHQVSLGPTDFQKLISSLNTALDHDKKNGIATSHLIFNGINIIPTQITAEY